MYNISAQNAVSYRKAREAAWYNLLKLIFKIPSKPLISVYHLLNRLMLGGRNEKGQNWMGIEPSKHIVLQGHDSLAFLFSHDGASRAPITSEEQDPNLLEDF